MIRKIECEGAAPILVDESWPEPEVWGTQEELEWLLLLESGNVQAQELELARCKADPWRFLTHWVKTEDAQNKEHPFQPFPNLKHLEVLTRYWQARRYLLVPKSRQLSVTWWGCGIYLYDSLFYPSRLTFFQNRKEEDSDANIRRVLTMYNSLPTWFRLWQPAKYTYCNLSFTRNRSEIRGIPQGADHVRGYTCTGILEDEMSFTEDCDAVLAAVKPALGKTGRFTGVSSASPSYFADLVFDRV